MPYAPFCFPLLSSLSLTGVLEVEAGFVTGLVAGLFSPDGLLLGRTAGVVAEGAEARTCCACGVMGV